MELDRERILFLIGEIEKSVSILREFAPRKKEKLIQDAKSMGSIKYYLILAIEACIDISNHIIAKERLGVPESYSDCFKMLGNKSLISRGLSDKLIKMAKFRNLLVHLYWKIDEEKVYEILQSELTDFDEFIEQIARRYL